MKVYALKLKDNNENYYVLYSIHKTLLGAETEMKKHRCSAYILELKLYE